VPEFLSLVVCEKLIQSTDGTVSLISLLDSYHVPAPPEPPPDNLAVPLQWCAVSLWRRLPEDDGLQFEQQLELLMPDGTVLLTGVMPINLKNPMARCYIPWTGFPISQAGEYIMKLSWRRVGTEAWHDAAHYPIQLVYLPRSPKEEAPKEEAATTNIPLTKEQTEILLYAARRGVDGVFAVDKGIRIELSLAGDAGMKLVRTVGMNQERYAAALAELVSMGYMQLDSDSRPEGGNELRYVLTTGGLTRVLTRAVS
jgi:hypothetical protein